MMKVLLVDDEFLARNAVHLLLTQEGCPSCAVREACNGREAIRLIAKEAPDLALIDVSMPVMGGLELLAWIQAHAPAIACVMLSSYSDFEYVRGALRSGAQDYLLKHQLTLPILREVMALVRPSPQMPLAAHEDWDTGLQRYLATGDETEAPAIPNEGLFFAATPADATHAQSILKTCRHLLAGNSALVCLPQGHTLAFWFSPKPKEPHAQLHRRVQKAQQLLREAVERYHNVPLNLTEPKRCTTLGEMRNHYRYQQAVTGSPPGAGDLPGLAFDTALTAAVIGGHQETIAQLIAQRFQGVPHSSGEMGPLDNALAQLLKKCYAHLLRIEEPSFMRGQSDRSLASYYTEAFCSLAEEHHRVSYSGFPEIVRKTLMFINASSAQDIGLTDIAAHVSVNYSYLSFLFKKETGIGITQYLSAVRVGASMRLMLLQDLPVSQAGEAAGFGRYSHFMTVFKAVTGLSPTAFRRHERAFDYMMHFSPLGPEPLWGEQAGTQACVHDTNPNL